MFIKHLGVIMRNHFLNHALTAIFILTVCYVSTLYSEISVDPFGVVTLLDPDSEEIVEVTLSNDGEIDLAFDINFRSPVDDERRIRIPRRDDFGDLLEFYDMQNYFWCGLAWNGEEILAADYDNQRIYFWNIEEEELTDDFRVNFFPWGAAFDGRNYWIAADNPNRLRNIDREGDLLSTIDLNYIPAGVAFDGENLWVSPYGGNGVLQYMTVEGEVIRSVNCAGMNGIASWALTWVPEHDGGHLWVITEGSRLMQLRFDEDEEEFEIIQGFNYNYPGGTYGLTHDGENIWFSVYTPGGDGWGIGIIDDGIEEPRWLLVDPGDGIIAADDEETFELTFTSAGYEPGTYHLLVVIELTEAGDDPEFHSIIEFSALMSIDTDVGNITGVITDADNNRAIEGAMIALEDYEINRLSDPEGNYAIENLPFGEYNLMVSASDFLDRILQVEIDEVNDFEVDAALLHSVCAIAPPEIIIELAPGQDAELRIEVENTGNGPLTYTVERCLLGDANADPWTLRLSHMFGQDRDDSRIQGAVFAEDRFYVAGAHGNEPAIYIFSREGEYIDLFIQPGEDRYGMKDLAWDGSLIWGAIGEMIYGMTLDGDVEVEFEGPFRPTSNLAWDPEHELLWVSAITSDIAGINRNGDLVSEMDHQGLRMYGFGYWPDDPDDSPLYIFHKVRDVSDQVVHKMNLDNGELTEVSILEPEGGGSAAGAFITNEYDIYSWVFMAVVNDGGDDRVDIWQIDARKDWFLLDPMEGVIEAGNTQEFDLTLDATGLPPEVFEGELVFLHDGVGSETHLPVTLRVVEGPVQAERTIQLDIGWNMVSVNLQPDPDDIRVLMRELVEADLLLLMKDGQGRFYSPEFDFCNIPGWNVADGYQMKMDDAGEVTLAGITVMADDAISLTDGWNLISYYPRTPIDAIVAFSGIVDQLLIAKDGWGRFYNPEWGFSNMGDLEELRGYQVKVTEDLDLVYRLQAEDDEFVLNVCNRQGKLLVHPLTGNNMSLLVKGGRVQDGEIGVFTNGELVGSGVLEDGVCGIAIWGDDPTTPEIDGAVEGASLELSVFDENGSHPVQFETLAGDDLYQLDGFWAVELMEVTMLPDEFGIVSAYPNPFNSQTRVTYNLMEATHIDLALFDLSGRRIFDLVFGHRNAGQYAVVIDGSSLASGVYLVQLKANGDVSRSKITLVK